MADIINDNGTIEVDLGVFFAEVTDLRIETKTLSTGETGENVFATIRFRHPKTGEDCGVSMRAGNLRPITSSRPATRPFSGRTSRGCTAGRNAKTAGASIIIWRAF
jgi:hypothetical protein